MTRIDSEPGAPAPTPVSPSRVPGPRGVVLVLLLLLSLSVRVAGIGSDLPYVYHWDEPTPVNLAVWMHEESSLDPQFFHYPGGLSYLLAAEYAGVLLGGRALGTFESSLAAREWLSAGTPPRPPGGGVAYTFPTEGVPLLYLLGRWSVAILGTLTVFWVFRLGSAAGGASAGWLAAALLALSTFHARHSSLVTTDVPCAAFLTWFFLELVRGRSWFRAGLALGLAAAFKYTGGIGVYAWPIGMAILVTRANATLSVRALLGAWNLFWVRLAPVAALVFLVLNPYVLLSPRRFFRDFFYEARHMREGTGHFGGDVGAGEGGLRVVSETLGAHLGAILLGGLLIALVIGLGALLSPRIGFVRRIRGTRPSMFPEASEHVLVPAAGATVTSLLVLFCLVYLVQLVTWRTVYDRYLLPLWPLLVVLVAVGWASVLTWLGKRRRFFPWVGAILIVASIVPGLVRSMRARLAPDPRVLMTRWVEAEIAPTITMATEPSGPLIDTSERTVFRVDLLGRRSLEDLRRDGVQYVVSTGREDMLPASAPESLRTRKVALLASCREVWRDGKYAVFAVPAGDSVLLDAQRAVQEQRFAEALQLTKQGLDRDPENGIIWILHGQALQGLGDAAAEDAYIRASELRPTDPAPLYAIGNLELAARRWERAFSVFAEAGRRSPRDPIALINQSTALGYWAAEVAAADSLDMARRMMADAMVRARAAAVLAPTDTEFQAQESRLRRMAERAGISID